LLDQDLPQAILNAEKSIVGDGSAKAVRLFSRAAIALISPDLVAGVSIGPFARSVPAMVAI
jgi:hypothetical protein